MFSGEEKSDILSTHTLSLKSKQRLSALRFLDNIKRGKRLLGLTWIRAQHNITLGNSHSKACDSCNKNDLKCIIWSFEFPSL